MLLVHWICFEGTSFCHLQEANSSTDYSERFDHLREVLSTPPLFTVVRVNSLKSNVHDVCQQLQVILYEVIIIIIIITIIIIIIIIIIIVIILSPYEAFQLAIVKAWLRIWTRDYREQTQLVVRVGLELGASELQVQHCNRSATLPPNGEILQSNPTKFCWL